MRRYLMAVGWIAGVVAPCADLRADQVIEYASQAGKPGPKRKCTDQKNPDESMSLICRYYQANDNLTLSALYQTEKLQNIQDAIKDGRESEAEKALGAFCRAGEDAAACFPRYQAFQALALVRVRQAIGKNEDTIAMLTSNRQTDGTVVGDAHAILNEFDESVHTPDIPRMSDLEREFKQSGTIGATKKMSHGDVMKWSQELVNPNPSLKFTEFRSTPVKANPFDAKSAGKLNMTLRETDQRTKVDANVEKLVTAKSAELRNEIQSASQADLSDTKDVVNPNALKAEDPLSYAAIQEARTLMISAAKKEIAKRDTASSGGSADVKSAGAAARARVGDEERIEQPKANPTHIYIKYDLATMFQEISSLTK